MLIIIIVVLSLLCVLFATGVIDFQKNGKNNQSWVDYLNIKNITIKNSVWNSEKEECHFEKNSMSSDDISRFIEQLANSKITKHYYGDVPPTGTVCSNRFTLEYENNKIGLESDGYVWISDDVLSSKIDLDVDDVTYAEGTTGGEYVCKFDVNFAEIIDNYR